MYTTSVHHIHIASHLGGYRHSAIFTLVSLLKVVMKRFSFPVKLGFTTWLYSKLIGRSISSLGRSIDHLGQLNEVLKDAKELPVEIYEPIANGVRHTTRLYTELLNKDFLGDKRIEQKCNELLSLSYEIDRQAKRLYKFPPSDGSDKELIEYAAQVQAAIRVEL